MIQVLLVIRSMRTLARLRRSGSRGCGRGLRDGTTAVSGNEVGVDLRALQVDEQVVYESLLEPK